MMGLNSWQTLLWLVCFAALLAPIIVIIANAISIGWYKAKMNFISTLMGALSKTIEQATKKKKEEGGNG